MQQCNKNISGGATARVPPGSGIGGRSGGRHSALVEPYFSNINSPSRPKRKQKINREQNRSSDLSGATSGGGGGNYLGPNRNLTNTTSINDFQGNSNNGRMQSRSNTAGIRSLPTTAQTGTTQDGAAARVFPMIHPRDSMPSASVNVLETRGNSVNLNLLPIPLEEGPSNFLHQSGGMAGAGSAHGNSSSTTVVGMDAPMVAATTAHLSSVSSGSGGEHQV